MTALYFISSVIIALFSIFCVWLGRKYKVSYYNSLLIGWFLYFILLLVIQQYERDQFKNAIYFGDDEIISLENI